MENKEYKITVDDLIVEYMVYKVTNGYDPSFSLSEFRTFFSFFESKMKVEDTLDNGIISFQRFFEKKEKHDWWRYKNILISEEKEIIPHMEMIYSEKDHEYIILANYNLGSSDMGELNTYSEKYVPCKRAEAEKKTAIVRDLIQQFLSTYPKRKIEENIEITESDLMIGKYVCAEIILYLWQDYIKKYEDYFPFHCRNIHEYLFHFDFAKIIKIPSIREEIFELYLTLPKKIAYLYHKDNCLKISSLPTDYLAYANYKLLKQDHEKIMENAFLESFYNGWLFINAKDLTFNICYASTDVRYSFGFGLGTVKNTTSLGNEKAKKVIADLDKTLCPSILMENIGDNSFSDKIDLKESLDAYLEKLKNLAKIDPEKASSIAFRHLFDAGIIDENGNWKHFPNAESFGNTKWEYVKTHSSTKQ